MTRNFIFSTLFLKKFILSFYIIDQIYLSLKLYFI